jgi:FAD/FMN-containing dehydrogenase
MYRIREALPPESEAPRPLDMDRDGIGLLWATPIVPMDGKTLATLVRTAEEVALAEGIQPDISLVSLDDWRYLDGIFGFLFDARVAGERERAERAFEAFSKVAAELGCPSYRTGIQHSPLAITPARRDTLRRLRQAFDPHRVLSPWRTESETEPEASS